MFVVTGGGSGIGKALAISLAARGHSVLVIGRRESCLMDVAAYSKQIQYLCADVASDAGRQLIVSHLSAYTHLDGLIHNAGVIDPILPLDQLDADAWRGVMATNLDAPFLLTNALLPLLKQGRILSIGSGAAYFPVVGWAPYCVSKAALSMLVRCWQLEYPSMAIASVMPGIIDTDMQATIRASQSMDQEKHAFFVDLKKSNKLLSTEQVAAFLTSLLLDVERAMFSSKEWDIYELDHQEFVHGAS